MKTLLLAILMLSVDIQYLSSQTRISGSIIDTEGKPLPGANILVKGSYDGTSADVNGKYGFITSLSGKQVIMASFIGYGSKEVEITLDGSETGIDFTLEEQKDQIGDVVITAGMFETADQKKSVTLQPLDIVTTPSAAGDIYGALTSLPGATLVGEDGRLFVRGGDGYESKTFIDGLLVKKPYSSTTPDLPTRGRFSPFLFSGTMFSTGGYSAEYGQALSSALILTTNAFPDATQTEVSLMTVGLGATQTFKSEKAAVSAGFEYYNLKPYFSLAKQEIDWEKYPQSIAGTLVGRYRLKDDGILRVFSNFKSAGSSMIYPDLAEPGSMQKIILSDKNNYTNINYSGTLRGSWILKTGVSFTGDAEKITFRTFKVDNYNTNFQGKIVLKNKLSKKLAFLLGAEEVFNRYHQIYNEQEGTFLSDILFNDYNTALFAETELNPLKKLALRAGLRGEYSSVIGQPALAFRGSVAWAFSNTLQTSLAYGSFYQTPEETLLRFTHELSFEKAEHYIANIQYEANDRILRMEGYYKKYTGLVVYNESELYNPLSYSNNGNGFSQGLDIFFRDRKTIRNLDYWVSYSFLDSKRYYRYYPVKATPSFAARHSFNAVAKQYVSEWNTLFGAILTWASGRPYNDPNKQVFMGEHTRDYLDLSINISYLTTVFKQSAIVYTSLSNVFGRENIYSYRYYEKPDQQGVFESMPVRPEAKRFFMIGLFVTIS
jgi:hypothetical protein